jgi:hypothetical protein
MKCYFAGIQKGFKGDKPNYTKKQPLKVPRLGFKRTKRTEHTKTLPLPLPLPLPLLKITSDDGIRTISKMYKYLFLLSETRVFQYLSIKGKHNSLPFNNMIRHNNILEAECKEYYAYKYWKMYLGYKKFIRNVINYHVELNELEHALDLCQNIINIFRQEHNIPLAYATLHELKRNKTIIKSSNFHNRFNSLRELEKRLAIHTSHITPKQKLFDATSIVIEFQTTTNATKIYEDIIRTKNAIIKTNQLSFDVNEIDIEVYNTILEF